MAESARKHWLPFKTNYKMELELIGRQVRFRVDSNIYSENVLFKCFYWYSKNFVVDISKHGSEFVVSLTSKLNELDQQALNNLSEKIHQDLVDFKLRDIVAGETKSIRELIVAKAFAYYEPGHDPSTSLSDPVGFNPQDISLYE